MVKVKYGKGDITIMTRVLPRRCKNYTDFKEIEKEAEAMRKRYDVLTNLLESEFLICNIKCGQQELKFLWEKVGCVFNNTPNLTTHPDCPCTMFEVEANKISLAKLRELYDKESEW